MACLTSLLLSLGVPVACLAAQPPAVTQKSTEEVAKNKEAVPEKAATETAPEIRFVRLRKDEGKEPVALETAITRYVPANGDPQGLQVDLVGAIHVGEKEYYEQLNKLFADYDGVLFELVAPEGTKIPRGGRKSSGGSAITYLQQMLKNTLALEFQLEHVDYTKGNMIHADMTPSEFSASMKKRGESFFKMFFKMMGQAMALQSKNANSMSDAQLIVALLSRDRAFKLKRLMAVQMQDVEMHLALLYGPDGSTIITERNKKALEVLDREIKNGKKKLAIFYGAGHLPDFETRLQKDFGLKRESQRWLEAWKLTRDGQESDEKDKSQEAEAMDAVKSGA
jgi:arsenate reductase-like glutaredoxin family protein